MVVLFDLWKHVPTLQSSLFFSPAILTFCELSHPHGVHHAMSNMHATGIALGFPVPKSRTSTSTNKDVLAFKLANKVFFFDTFFLPGL